MFARVPIIGLATFLRLAQGGGGKDNSSSSPRLTPFALGNSEHVTIAGPNLVGFPHTSAQHAMPSTRSEQAAFKGVLTKHPEALQSSVLFFSSSGG